MEQTQKSFVQDSESRVDVHSERDGEELCEVEAIRAHREVVSIDYYYHRFCIVLTSSDRDSQSTS
jgi:hypothetical protein